MLRSMLSQSMKLTVAKAIHDLATPLGALILCVDEIKEALPNYADIIESSVESLSHRLQFWRLLLTGGEDSPTFTDTYNLLDAMCKAKNISLKPIAMCPEYSNIYVRLILSISLVVIEGLPRGGKIEIDAEMGIIKASGPKCYLSKEFKEAFFDGVKIPNSRHIMAILIKDWANQMKINVSCDHSHESIAFIMQKAN